jgi:hypothetical protein
MKKRETLKEFCQRTGRPWKPLTEFKPAHVCECGKSYGFLIPAVCECGRPVPELKGTVPFDVDGYRKFAARADTEGVGRATAELLGVAIDPVHQNPVDNKWWHWCEDWATAEGPFETEQLCREALAKYCEELDRART